jgi:hypothetical protein
MSVSVLDLISPCSSSSAASPLARHGPTRPRPASSRSRPQTFDDRRISRRGVVGGDAPCGLRSLRFAMRSSASVAANRARPGGNVAELGRGGSVHTRCCSGARCSGPLRGDPPGPCSLSGRARPARVTQRLAFRRTSAVSKNSSRRTRYAHLVSVIPCSCSEMAGHVTLPLPWPTLEILKGACRRRQGARALRLAWHVADRGRALARRRRW